MAILERDWGQERPDSHDVNEALGNPRFELFPLESPRFKELLAALQATHVNGGALFVRFQLWTDRVPYWFGSGSPIDESRFFQRFLTGPELRAALPELRVGDDLATAPGFAVGGGFTLDGELARRLSEGGAHRRFRGTAYEAKMLAWRGCRDLFDEHSDEVLVYRSIKPWSPWFQNLRWNATWLGMDLCDMAVWLLCVTDTD